MAWLLYGGYIGIHWGGFLADMAFQMDRKQSRGFLTYWQFEDRAFAALCIGIACHGLWTKCADLLCYIALAIPCWLV